MRYRIWPMLQRRRLYRLTGKGNTSMLSRRLSGYSKLLVSCRSVSKKARIQRFAEAPSRVTFHLLQKCRKLTSMTIFWGKSEGRALAWESMKPSRHKERIVWWTLNPPLNRPPLWPWRLRGQSESMTSRVSCSTLRRSETPSTPHLFNNQLL